MSPGSHQEPLSDSHTWMEGIAKGWKAYQKAFSSGKKHAFDALGFFGEAAQTLRETGDREHLPLALDGMGASFHLLGTKADLERARRCYAEEMRLLRKSQNKTEFVQVVSSQQAVLRDLALLSPASALGFLTEGFKLGEQAMTIAAKEKDEKGLAWVTKTTADLCCVLARLDSERASSHLEVAVELYEKAVDLWERLFRSGDPHAQKEPGAAVRTHIGQALEGKTLTMLGLAESYIAQRTNLDDVQRMLDEAFLFYSSGEPDVYQMAHVESLYGGLSLARNNTEQASLHFRAAAESFQRLGFSEVFR